MALCRSIKRLSIDPDFVSHSSKIVTFVANADQISALAALAGYRREGNENVVLPWGAGCHQIGIYAYREAVSESPRAVLGLTDLSARKAVKGILGSDVLTFAFRL